VSSNPIRDALSRGELPPEIEKAIKLVESLPSGGISLEELQAQRALEREHNCLALEQLARDLARQEAERKRLWGNKFPRVLGARPPEKTDPVNPVKPSRKKRAK
jgi:hypothetical protein